MAVTYQPLAIERIVDETSDARSFVFAVPAELREAFAYEAGQFLTFRVPWEGDSLVRCYSLASCPVTEKEWKVTVKRVADGRISNWFNDQLAVGDRVEVMAPLGHFVLRESDAPMLLFAGGSGITPVISLIKTALHQTSRTMRLVYGNRDRGSIIFAEELERLQEASGGRLTIEHRFDDEHGFLDRTSLRPLLEGFEAAHAYLCGPEPFMAVVEETLLAEGFGMDRIFIERFEASADPDAPQVVVGHVEEGAVEGIPSEILVTQAGQEHTVPYTEGKSVLRSALDAGVDAPFACEEGYCGSCAAMCHEGTVTMPVNDVFTPAEVEKGWILTCQARVKSGPCKITYED